VIAAVTAANAGVQDPYGEDELTAALAARCEDLFGPATACLPVFNGSAANIVALGGVTLPHEAVICAASAHLNEDECGAIERLLGRKLLTVPAAAGKLTPEAVAATLGRGGQTRAVQPRVVSVTQSTELGTTYTAAELTALCDIAHDHGLLVHVDGARLANAAAFLGTGLAGASHAGVDLLSLGFTKLGGICADLVLLFSAELVQEPRFLHKQLLQAGSKTRFLSAQALALLDGDLCLRNAEHANAMALRLAAGVADVPGVRLSWPVESNSVFASIPPPARQRLGREFHFYDWDEARGEVRWTCSWNTELETVDRLIAAVQRECG
jgi:threonine aldolase